MTNDLINLDERTTSALTETTNVGYLTPLKKELEDLKKEIGQTDVSQIFNISHFQKEMFVERS